MVSYITDLLENERNTLELTRETVDDLAQHHMVHRELPPCVASDRFESVLNSIDLKCFNRDDFSYISGKRD